MANQMGSDRTPIDILLKLHGVGYSPTGLFH